MSNDTEHQPTHHFTIEEVIAFSHELESTLPKVSLETAMGESGAEPGIYMAEYHWFNEASGPAGATTWFRVRRKTISSTVNISSVDHTRKTTVNLICQDEDDYPVVINYSGREIKVNDGFRGPERWVTQEQMNLADRFTGRLRQI